MKSKLPVMKRTPLYHLKVVLVWLAYSPAIIINLIIVSLDRMFRFRLPFPRDVAALANMQDWCIEVLKRSNVLPKDAFVNDYKVTPLNQNIIFRSNAGLVEINYTASGENKTLKCFAKFAPTMGTLWNRTVFNLQLNHIKETNFNTFFIKTDKHIAAPEVYYSAISVLTGNLCLITEFMSYSVEHEGVHERMSLPLLELALKNLASLHAGYWKSTSEQMKKVFPIEDSTVHLFDSLTAFTWSTNARNVMVKSWCYMNQRETVLHGDVRLGNMFFPKDEKHGRFVFIDWQAARQGKAAFDLAYFLLLSLITSHRKEIEQHCIETYHRELVAKGVTDYSLADLEEDYRHGCLCVLALLSLPMLSGEVSAEGEAAAIFKYGMGIWRERMAAKFEEFDYRWMAEQYALTEQQSRDAVAEMLMVIERRLKRIKGTSGFVVNEQQKVQRHTC